MPLGFPLALAFRLQARRKLGHGNVLPWTVNMLAYDPSNAVLVIEDSVVKVVVGSSNDNVNAQVGTEDKLETSRVVARS